MFSHKLLEMFFSKNKIKAPINNESETKEANPASEINDASDPIQKNPSAEINKINETISQNPAVEIKMDSEAIQKNETDHDETKNEAKIKSKKNWDKIRFWAKHYNLEEKGIYKTDIAKQNPKYFIESECGYYLNTRVPFTRQGAFNLGLHFGPPIQTIGELFELWKKRSKITGTTESTSDFKSWLHNVVLAEYVDKQSPLAQNLNPLKFYNVEEQQLLKLIIEDGILYQVSENVDVKLFNPSSESKENPKPFDTNGESFLFVQDKHGLFYATPSVISGYEMHHSSILNNEPVTSAGMMAVSHGQIKSISNMSGHYLPDLPQFYDAVSLLNNKNAFKTDAELVFYSLQYSPAQDADVLTPRTFIIATFLNDAKESSSRLHDIKDKSAITEKPQSSKLRKQ